MKTKKIDGTLLKKMFEHGAENLEINKKIVDELNVFPVPDGDTGTNMSMTFTHSVSEMKRVQGHNLYSIAKTASSGALIGARGNSGVILSQLLRGFAEGCKDKEYLDFKGLADSFKCASDMAYKAVMKPTEGTILTVAREMAEYAIENVCEYDSIEDFLGAIIEQGYDALKRTPDMLPVLKESGVVDSGGQGLMYILEGAYKGLINKELVHEIVFNINQTDRLVDDSHMRPEDITFGYCTEYIIKDSEDADENKLRESLNAIGDSVLVIKDEDVIKVHLHTDHPGLAFEKGLELGPLVRMKVDNMREMIGSGKLENEKGGQTSVKKPYGFVAVSPGDGITETFQDIGITRVISGGQTMNPSTQDFLDEINKINADYIFLFPNNSNIIMAANQAQDISEKNIFVIPTKTIPQCVTSMLAFNPDLDCKDNEISMLEALETVKTGEITYAVRDTKVDGLKINKNDIIGIFDGKIVSSGTDIIHIAKTLIDSMIDGNDELISLYYGRDVTKDDVEELASILEDSFTECDVEINNGKQPLYYYIVSVE